MAIREDAGRIKWQFSLDSLTIIFFAGVAWGALQWQVSNHTKRIDDHDAKMYQHGERISALEATRTYQQKSQPPLANNKAGNTPLRSNDE